MAEKKLRGLLDRAQATIGGLLGDFPQGFNAGAVAGVAGYPGDIAYMLDTAGRAITGQDTQPAAQDFPGTTDYIAAKAGYPIPGSFSGQLGAAVGGMLTPGPGDLGRLAPLGAMFLGAKAKTAMPDVLNMAQEMEKAGASADDIWLATGAKGQPWFKGADGKWKFWISDKNAEYRPGAVVGQAKEEHAAMLDEAEAAVIMRHQMDRAGLGVGEAKDWFRQAFGRDPPEGAGQWLRNYDAITLMQRYLGLESRGVPSFSNIGAPLSRFLYHPELYAAVPELANMPVRGVTPGALGLGIGGRASLAKGIEIRDDIMPILETGKSILSHEIQHPIQELMGFGTGTNTTALAKESAQAEEQIQIFNDELRVMRQALDRAQQSGDYVQAERITQESIRMQKQRNALIKLAQRDPEMAYWNAAGEAEARNTQTLLDKGPEDWATFRPWLTQDVPTEQQIVRFGDGPAMAIPFWHGSPHKYDAVDLNKIGTGEGAQAYGWGYYGAESKDVANEYADRLSRTVGESSLTLEINGEPADFSAISDPAIRDELLRFSKAWEEDYSVKSRDVDINSALDNIVFEAKQEITNRFTDPDEIPAIKARIDEAEKLRGNVEFKPTERNLYKGEYRWPDPAKESSTPLTGEDLLQWDRPLSEQPESVRRAVSELGIVGGNMELPAGGLDMSGGGRILDNRDGKVKPGSVAPYVLVSGDTKFDISEKDLQRMLGGSDDPTGEQIYTRLTAKLGDQNAASKALGALGAPGIRYLDGMSRDGGQGTYNYVMFDDKGIKLLERNGSPIEDFAARRAGKAKPYREAMGVDGPMRLPDNALMGTAEFKVKPPKRLFRGVGEGGSTTGTYALGKGLYTSRDKSFAAMYGEVSEVSPDDAWPRNPLVLNQVAGGAPGAFADWALKTSGLKNMREFNKLYADPGEFVRSLGYDGVIAGDEVVRYPIGH